MRIKFSGDAVLPLAAAGLFAFAVASVIRPSQGRADPVIAPPAAPYAASVAGVGVVEPESEVIAVASELPGVIREVMAKPGDRVVKGAPLFRLDSRALEAARAEALANVAAAEAAEAVARVNRDDERKRLAIFEGVADKRAVSVDELDRMRFAVARADAALAQAKAAREAAMARAASIDTDLTRQIATAPIDGQILSVDARPGEFAAAGPLEVPLITMGATERLHVRVEIDESDIARFSRSSAAVAVPRGEGGRRLPLAFVRMEPQASPKRALAGGSERVDARVIEVVYVLEKEADAIVGQRLDVFIDDARASAIAKVSS